MKLGTGLAWFAGSYFVLVMAKDGTLTTIVGNVATTVQTGIKGLTPITKVA